MFADKSLHAEAGAMRLPDFHPMVLALADKLGIRRRLFYNADVLPGAEPSGPVPPVVYRSFTGEVWTNGAPVQFTAPPAAGRSLIQVNGRRLTRAEYAANPADINRTFGSNLTVTTTAAENNALDPVTVPPTGPIDNQIAAWAKLISTYDDYSTHRYLVEAAGWGLADIEAVGTLESRRARRRDRRPRRWACAGAADPARPEDDLADSDRWPGADRGYRGIGHRGRLRRRSYGPGRDFYRGLRDCHHSGDCHAIL